MASITSDREDLDRQYNARATVADVNIYLDAYRQESERMLRTLPCIRDLAYGPGQDEKLDIFQVPGVSDAPAFVFLHGGYWRALSKEDSCFMAGNFTAQGIAVVAVNYSLSPGAKLQTIVSQVRSAIAWLWKNGSAHGLDPGRIVVAGSSAGGHLAGMALSGGWQEAQGLPQDVIKAGFGVSGLYDLTPIPNTHVNEWLGLDDAMVREMSPLFHLPERSCHLVLAFAEADTDEFKRQSHAYRKAWEESGFPVICFEVPRRNHFDVILDWQHPDSFMTQSVLNLFNEIS
ncbi:MAG: alpha/beta hydrolase [Desulfatirhabdiaceae bacterium]|nr:alpha/beta hydrolase [Desulfatirhabdiaceae bacterium]